MRFIILTAPNGQRNRFNVANIVIYASFEDSTHLWTNENDPNEYHVKETPEEIDTILINNGILVHGKAN